MNSEISGVYTKSLLDPKNRTKSVSFDALTLNTRLTVQAFVKKNPETENPCKACEVYWL